MSREPTRSDAWLLTALAYGKGDPAATMAAADHVNIGYPLPSEWVHACEVLGMLGLVEEHWPMPRLTNLGERTAEPIIKHLLPRLVPDRLLPILKKLPTIGSPVTPPDRGVLDEAIVELGRRHRQ